MSRWEAGNRHERTISCALIRAVEVLGFSPPMSKLKLLLGIMKLSVLTATLLLPTFQPVKAAEDEKSFVMPDLQAWEKVDRGMTAEDLLRTLGKPIQGTLPGDPDYRTNIMYRWNYGYVVKKSVVFPIDLSFTVFVEKGLVTSKEGPFGDVPLSADGKPTVPKLMMPTNEAFLTHYPRLIDFRWYPSSGDYPMKYEIEVGVYFPSDKWKEDPLTAEVPIPYFSYEHSGSNAGRWRVRAVNAKGKSEWSKYFLFGFTK